MPKRKQLYLKVSPEKFRQAMKGDRWNVSDLAKAVGVSERTMYRIFKEGEVPLDTGLRIGMATNTSVEDLFGSQDDDLMESVKTFFGRPEKDGIW